MYGIAEAAVISSLFGYADLQNAYKRPPVFPRSPRAKVERMTRLMDWKRDQIRKRYWERLYLLVAWAIGIPIAIAVVSLVWRACAYLVAM